MISATEALDRLREGNRRFVDGERASSDDPGGRARLRELAAKQNPFAIILGCSDSRVPAEIVFDQGLGDLFVIRVAGNIVAPSQIGSVESPPSATTPGWSSCSATWLRRGTGDSGRTAAPLGRTVAQSGAPSSTASGPRWKPC